MRNGRERVKLQYPEQNGLCDTVLLAEKRSGHLSLPILFRLSTLADSTGCVHQISSVHLVL